ncbi:type IV toxin-antitoxin system AbiEi family antitoxin [Cupriavidus necator]|uniref:type IV toxin-antitoxin system AbiEi family antitoxin n=1 Tax=Cupriavidus necator TaxID=106590 RepID=UPI0012D34D61|nr:type IV toxin-antitoxin system AbiEi family antitoxin [Cupriavidus necator]
MNSEQPWNMNSEVITSAVGVAFEALKRSSGVDVYVRPATDSTHNFPVVLKRGTIVQSYVAEWKTTIANTAALTLIRTRLEGKAPDLLITTYLSPFLAGHCRGIGLQCIDTAGNAYLEAPGLYVYVSGRRPDTTLLPARARGTGNPTALRMILALLNRPSLLQATYREIAQASDIALGSVGGVFRELAARGLLLEEPTTKRRRLTAPDRVLDEWVANYPSILRPRLQVGRYATPDPDWWRAALEKVSGNAYWSGDVAAEKMTGFLQAETQTMYVDVEHKGAILKHLMQKYRLRPQPDGAIEILEAFWPASMGNVENAGIAPAVVVYADLMASLDSRNLEAAGVLRAGVIQHALDQF